MKEDNAVQGEMFEAAKAGDLEKVRALLAAGVDPNIEDEDTMKPLEYAADHSHLEIAKLLLASGADPNLSEDGFTPLLGAIEAQSLDMCKLFIRAGVDLDRRHEVDDGPTPLTAACDEGRDNVFVTLLLEAGADPDARNYNGWTPLMIAAHAGRADAARALLAAGASPSASLETDKEITALSIAKHHKQDEVANLLAEALGLQVGS